MALVSSSPLQSSQLTTSSPVHASRVWVPASSSCSTRSSYGRSSSGRRQLISQPQVQLACQGGPRLPRYVPCSQASPANVARETPMEALSPEQQNVWRASVQAVVDAVEGMSPEEAEDKLQQAFGWGPRGNKFWRGRKVKEAPQEGQVSSALEYLRSVGVAGPEMAKVVKTFPEALACSVDDQLKESVKKLEGEWKLKNQVLVKALARQPQVLGYDYDCEGSCQGECNRCWARF
uniref:Uncharacterized protein n=1 Tax=Dunaliella tertiolecta TaxID=3047 RepID=A0A7S3RAH8_DUNTE|mmetsp:Transcript_23990/g.65813  ORF Transcript_23990/g.65813 Transcript_23990/m.65813 type:complete len:234 (+) Transcript_23990:88-789(+)